MNLVLMSRIIELTEKKTRFQKIKSFSSNWKAVVVVALSALTVKVLAEQLAMIFIRGIK